MVLSWLESSILTLSLLAFGGFLVGLSGLLVEVLGKRWGRAMFAPVLAVVLAGAGTGAAVAAPLRGAAAGLLALAGVCGLLWATRTSGLARICAWVLRS